MEKHIAELLNHTDLYPWYWIAYGEKSYGFAVVEAYPLKDGQPYPTPGSKLELHHDDPKLWVGDNGIEMVIDSFISDIERQNGDSICSFIAKAHATHMGEFLPKV